MSETAPSPLNLAIASLTPVNRPLLPPGWTVETIREACGNRYSNRHFKDKPSWGFMQDDLFALLCKAYEQGRREVEEAVGAGGVQPLTKPIAEAVDALHYVQPVPDHCDRIVWRNRYFHLPLRAGVDGEEGSRP